MQQPTHTNARSRPSAAAPPLLLLSALLLAACGGGGGGSGGGGGGGGGPGTGGVNEGAFTVEAFDYEDPRPAAFHPLGTDATTLDPLAELALFMPAESGPTAGRVLDDALAGSGELYDTGPIVGANATVLAAAAGNVDQDAEHELVTLRREAGALNVMVSAIAPGSFVSAVRIWPAAEGGETLALGDLDGDHRDEIVLASRSSVRVYDDREGGYLLLSRTPVEVFSSEALRAVATDLDGDGRDELALLAGRENDRVSLQVFDDQEPGAPTLALLRERFTVAFAALASDLSEGRLLAGDFDGDGGQELGVAYVEETGFHRVTLRSYRWSPESGLVEDGVHFEPLELHSPGSPTIPDAREEWDAVALDMTGDGDDEIALIVPALLTSFPAVYGFRLRRLDWNADEARLEGSDVTILAANVNLPVVAPSLCPADVDSDGAEELYVCFVEGAGGPKTVKLRLVDWAPGFQVTALPDRTLSSSAWAEPARLVAGDFDADGFVLRSTGVKTLSVADPIPVVLLTAAPTQAGIAQNYGATQTSYSIASSSATSIGVASQTTYSLSVGAEASFGLFGAHARATIESAFETSLVDTQRVTFTQGFNAAYDDDVIVFQGTLYRSYEYEIVSANDPALVGTYLTLDAPVDSKVYKWTVSYYNDEFGPEHAIGADVLPHVVGDPSTYRSRGEVEALVAAHVGWMDGSVTPVGLGGSSNSSGIELADEVTSTRQRTLTVGGEEGFSVTGASVTASYGLASTEIFSLTISEATAYAGEVGDIAAEDWGANQYDFGVAVYHHGVLADGQNEPVARVPGTRPYPIVTFWTNPVGSAYRD